jgi:parvulin-like peptidyl-prolyl isomerase
MKTRILFFIIISITFLANGQTLEEATKALRKVKEVEQIDVLKTQYPKWTIYTDKTMYSDSSKFPAIINAKIGDIVLKQYNSKAPTYVIKVVKDQDEELCKVKYIYLDGSKLSTAKIDSIRTKIIDRYTKGEDFLALVKEYTMDGNPTGDLDWFAKGMMDEEFDSKVRNRKKGEIFTVDVNKNKWYYVVLKTHANKMEKARLAIMIKYNK